MSLDPLEACTFGIRDSYTYAAKIILLPIFHLMGLESYQKDCYTEPDVAVQE